MIQQWWQALLLGIAGGLIPEILIVISAIRAGRPLVGAELVAGLLTGLLGSGVLLFGWKDRAPIDLAVQGAAFPSLFAGLVRVSTEESPARGRRIGGAGGGSDPWVEDQDAGDADPSAPAINQPEVLNGEDDFDSYDADPRFRSVADVLSWRI